MYGQPQTLGKFITCTLIYKYIPYVCMHKACINLCQIYKITYTYTYMFIYTNISTFTTEFTSVTLISFMPNYYCSLCNYMILVPKLGTFGCRTDMFACINVFMYVSVYKGTVFPFYASVMHYSNKQTVFSP